MPLVVDRHLSENPIRPRLRRDETQQILGLRLTPLAHFTDCYAARAAVISLIDG